MSAVRRYNRVALLCAFLIGIGIAPHCRSAEPQRTWTDSKGRRITATMMKVTGDAVELKLSDGTVHSCPIASLSRADQDIVRKYADRSTSPDSPRTASKTLSAACDALTKQIGESYDATALAKETPLIAVLDFSDVSGYPTLTGTKLSEELITKLFDFDKFEIQERRLLEVVLKQEQLRLDGFLDPTSAKKLGSLLGADAILTGTICDLGNSQRINARLIVTETGQIAAVASATVGAEQPQLDESADQITEKLISKYTKREGDKRIRVAVVEFTNLSGKTSIVGRLLAEEVLTRLYRAGTFELTERLLLERVLSEHKLSDDGLLDPSSLKELGKLFTVDAIVTGTSFIENDTLNVNARLIATDTGSLKGVAKTSLKVDQGVKDAIEGRTVPKGYFFRETFEKFNDGDQPDWGRNVSVMTGQDRRKWLITSLNGTHPVGHDIVFPERFYLEFTFTGDTGFSVIDSAIRLVDEKGKSFEIFWHISSRQEHTFKLPNGAMATAKISQEYGTIRINKERDVIKVLLDGNVVVSGNIVGYDKLVRFEVDMYKDRHGRLSFTDFKIGGL